MRTVHHAGPGGEAWDPRVGIWETELGPASAGLYLVFKDSAQVSAQERIWAHQCGRLVRSTGPDRPSVAGAGESRWSGPAETTPIPPPPSGPAPSRPKMLGSARAPLHPHLAFLLALWTWCPGLRVCFWGV